MNNIHSLCHWIRGKILLVLFSTLIGMWLSVTITSYLLLPEYESTAKIYIHHENQLIKQLENLRVGEVLGSEYVDLAKNSVLAEKVILNLKLDETSDNLLDRLAIENPQDTRLLYLTMKDKSPKRAKKIIDEYASVFSQAIKEEAVASNIVEYGAVEGTPVWPNKRLNIIIGGVFGFTISILAIYIHYRNDQKIHTSEQLEYYLNLYTLCSIPKIEVRKEKYRETTKTKSINRVGLRKKRSFQRTENESEILW